MINLFKQQRPASIQATHLGLDTIDESVARMNDGSYCAVIKFGSFNFTLLSPQQQEVVTTSYAAVLNGLSIKVQWCVDLRPVDIEEYISNQEQHARTLRPRLAALARDYTRFMQKLASSRNLMDHHCYLVVLVQGEPNVRVRHFWWPFGGHRAILDVETAHKQLTFRCDELARQIGRCGLTSHRLNDRELAELFYSCWCPDLARRQRVTQKLSEYEALVLQGALHQKARAA